MRKLKSIGTTIAAIAFAGMLSMSAMAQQQVIFKGDAGSSKYDGYSITLYRYDLEEKGLNIPGKIKDGKFEITAPYHGPGRYLLQNGYELEEKGGYAPYAILVDKPGVVGIKANMDALYKSSTTGSNAQAVVEAYDKALEQGKKPFMDGLRKKYGNDLVDNPGANMDNPKINELMKEWEDYEGKESPKIESTALLQLAKRHPASMAIPMLAIGSSAGLKLQEEVYGLLSSENKESRYGKELANTIAITRKSAVGTQIPDFSLPTAEGESISLQQQLKGKKYLYIDFWASWCGPCRGEFPKMKTLYTQFKDKGLEIWGISTDASKEQWLSALKQEELTWPQVWEGGTPKEKKASGNLFYVPYLPSTYLLDAKGQIVARDLRGEALEKKLIELLK